VSETLPYSWYTDEEVLRRERSLIFARSWQYAGRAAQVQQPGGFLATDAGGRARSSSSTRAPTRCRSTSTWAISRRCLRATSTSTASCSTPASSSARTRTGRSWSRTSSSATTARPRTRRSDYFFAPEADEGWLRAFFGLDDQVGREDTDLVESVQRGVATGLVDRGRLLLDAEPLLAAFQRLVRQQLAV
jgi:hypothetical protein